MLFASLFMPSLWVGESPTRSTPSSSNPTISGASQSPQPAAMTAPPSSNRRRSSSWRTFDLARAPRVFKQPSCFKQAQIQSCIPTPLSSVRSLTARFFNVELCASVHAGLQPRHSSAPLLRGLVYESWATSCLVFYVASVDLPLAAPAGLVSE